MHIDYRACLVLLLYPDNITRSLLSVLHIPVDNQLIRLQQNLLGFLTNKPTNKFFSWFLYPISHGSETYSSCISLKDFWPIIYNQWLSLIHFINGSTFSYYDHLWEWMTSMIAHFIESRQSAYQYALATLGNLVDFE